MKKEWYRRYYIIFLFATQHEKHCVKSVQIWSFSGSVYSRIRTEYGEIVRMRENTDQKNLRIRTLFKQCKWNYFSCHKHERWNLKAYSNICSRERMFFFRNWTIRFQYTPNEQTKQFFRVEILRKTGILIQIPKKWYHKQFID